MRIGVSFKIVPDYETLLPVEWIEPEQLDFAYIKKMYGCFDEPALEMALRIKDSLKAGGEEAECVAVTCGVPEGSVSEGLLRALFAAGFDDVVLLPKTGDFAPMDTARALAEYFKENPADLILTGRMVGPWDSGTVPFYLAEELKFSVFAEVVSARFDAGAGHIELTCCDGQWERLYGLKEPAVATVGDAEAAYLRLFPLKARMEAKKRVFTNGKPWTEYTADSHIDLRCVETTSGECRFIETQSAEDAASKLIVILKGEDTL